MILLIKNKKKCKQPTRLIKLNRQLPQIHYKREIIHRFYNANNSKIIIKLYYFLLIIILNNKALIKKSENYKIIIKLLLKY